MPVVLQDPGLTPKRNLLLELQKHFKSGEHICCAFAFATARGIGLLFDDPSVQANLKFATLQMIIGMDAITDTRSVIRFSQLCSDLKNVSVRFFLPSSGGIFHPKVSWVKIGDSGVVITGSGNLTRGGLETNFEAFSVISIDASQLATIEDTWNGFLAGNDKFLFELDSEEVKNAAEQNRKVNKAIKKAKKDVGIVESEHDVPEDSKTIFIQELTEGRGGRQRDVGTWAAKNYFEKDSDIYLTYVDSHGNQSFETAKKVTSKGSKNYAIDLDASKGVKESGGNLPIVVFLRTAPCAYLYHILDPQSADYKYVYSYLEKEGVKKSKAFRMEKIITPAELLDFWPSAPFLG